MSFKNTLIIIIVATTIIVSACNPNKVFNQRIEIPGAIWHQDSLMAIEFDINDNSIPYDLSVDLRTNEFYPASNLWLFIETHSPTKGTQRDTLQCILTDEQGHCLGDISGDICDYLISWHKAVKFPEQGKYKVTFQHGMRTEKLPCVHEIGLLIEKKVSKN